MNREQFLKKAHLPSDDLSAEEAAQERREDKAEEKREREEEFDFERDQGARP
jgi:hypothetical protein